MVLWPASPETVMLREPEIVSAPVVFARTPLSVVVRLTDATVVSFHFDNGWPAALKNAKLRVSVRPLLVTGGQTNLPVEVCSVHPLAGVYPASSSRPPVTPAEIPVTPEGENWKPIVDSADPITSRSLITPLPAVVTMAATVSPAVSCNGDSEAVLALPQAPIPMASATAPAANAIRFMFEYLIVRDRMVRGSAAARTPSHACTMTGRRRAPSFVKLGWQLPSARLERSSRRPGGPAGQGHEHPGCQGRSYLSRLRAGSNGQRPLEGSLREEPDRCPGDEA